MSAPRCPGATSPQVRPTVRLALVRRDQSAAARVTASVRPLPWARDGVRLGRAARAEPGPAVPRRRRRRAGRRGRGRRAGSGRSSRRPPARRTPGWARASRVSPTTAVTAAYESLADRPREHIRGTVHTSTADHHALLDATTRRRATAVWMRHSGWARRGRGRLGRRSSCSRPTRGARPTSSSTILATLAARPRRGRSRRPVDRGRVATSPSATAACSAGR